jgi:hypothetical protein
MFTKILNLMKGLKFALFLVFFMHCALPPMLAQKHVLDSVFLNNGSIVAGKVVNYKPNAYVRIQSEGDLYYFTSSSILKLAIHSFDPNDGISREIVVVEKKNVNVNENTTKSVVNTYGSRAEYSDIPYAHRMKLNDRIPEFMVFLQGSLEIESIYEPFKVYGQSKYQLCLSKRFVPTSAFGLGVSARHLDFERFAWVVFADIRTIHPRGDDFSSFSVNPGIVFYDRSVGYNLNFAYNYAQRIDRNVFFTIGLDLNYQSNRFRRYSSQNNWSNYVSGYVGAINLGIVVGLLF